MYGDKITQVLMLDHVDTAFYRQEIYNPKK